MIRIHAVKYIWVTRLRANPVEILPRIVKFLSKLMLLQDSKTSMRVSFCGPHGGHEWFLMSKLILNLGPGPSADSSSEKWFPRTCLEKTNLKCVILVWLRQIIHSDVVTKILLGKCQVVNRDSNQARRTVNLIHTNLIISSERVRLHYVTRISLHDEQLMNDLVIMMNLS